VNGILQNNLTGLTAKKGFIGFQNEGTPLEFRKLMIVSVMMPKIVGSFISNNP